MSINAKCSLKGVVAARQTLVGSLNVGGVIKVEPEHYEGDYEVIPSVEAQVLETNQKFMDDDVIVRKIPFYEVTNTTGGTTITIGKEV